METENIPKKDYALIPKNILNYSWYSDRVTFPLFIHCMLYNCYPSPTYNNIPLDEGELLFNIDYLSFELKVTTSEIRKSIKILKKCGLLEARNKGKYIMIKMLTENLSNDSPKVNMSCRSKIEPCFLYLMKCNRTGYIKIGISKDPKYREKTLQAEAPDIELIWSKKFSSRYAALKEEKTTHKMLSTVRVRGEWFDLCSTDIANIICKYE